MAEKHTRKTEVDRLSDALASIFGDLLVEETGERMDTVTKRQIDGAIRSGFQDYVEVLKIEQ